MFKPLCCLILAALPVAAHAGPLTFDDALQRVGYVNKGTAFTAYDKPLRGLDPVWQMVSPRGQHAVTSSPSERLHWLMHGWRPQGVAFYTVSFPNA